jgi:hypothetical protein
MASNAGGWGSLIGTLGGAYFRGRGERKRADTLNERLAQMQQDREIATQREEISQIGQDTGLKPDYAREIWHGQDFREQVPEDMPVIEPQTWGDQLWGVLKTAGGDLMEGLTPGDMEGDLLARQVAREEGLLDLEKKGTLEESFAEAKELRNLGYDLSEAEQQKLAITGQTARDVAVTRAEVSEANRQASDFRQNKQIQETARRQQVALGFQAEQDRLRAGRTARSAEVPNIKQQAMIAQRLGKPWTFSMRGPGGDLQRITLTPEEVVDVNAFETQDAMQEYIMRIVAGRETSPATPPKTDAKTEAQVGAAKPETVIKLDNMGQPE